MIQRAWAEEFADPAAFAPAARAAVGLHVADAAGAFFASAGSPAARALMRFLRGDGEPSGLAASCAAVIRRSECDDIHVASCITPASIAVPVALAFMAEGNSERAERAILCGYAAGLRLGSAIGGAAALGSGIWPTYFAAPIMAAATAAIMLGLDEGGIAAALGLAAAGAGGRLGRPAGTPSARWLAMGEAVAKGCRAALAVRAGFRGDPALISPEWLAAVADPRHVRPEALHHGAERLGIEQVGVKPFVTARQGANAIVAFQAILAQGVAAAAIDTVEIAVPALNAAMVGRPAVGGDRLSTISNVAFQVAAAALRPELLFDAERQGQPTADLADFARRVRIVAEPGFDRLLPEVWAGRAIVIAGGRRHEETRTEIPGDPALQDGAAVTRLKLSRMVAPGPAALCSAILDGGGEPESWALLWREMQRVVAS